MAPVPQFVATVVELQSPSTDEDSTHSVRANDVCTEVNDDIISAAHDTLRASEEVAADSNAMNILRGGFAYSSQENNENQKPSSRILRGFPPPSNSAYVLTSNGHYPSMKEDLVEEKNRFKPSPALSTIAGECAPVAELEINHLDTESSSEFKPTNTEHSTCIPLVRNVVEAIKVNLNSYHKHSGRSGSMDTDGTSHKTVASDSGSKDVQPEREPSIPEGEATKPEDDDGLTLGERLAENINWNRATWVMSTPGVSGIIYSAEEQREDFIRNIDSGAPFEYCKKCKKTHIPPGSPITLEDRDTCGAFLPEWFNTVNLKQPWDCFRNIFNELVILDEIEDGFTHRPDPAKGPFWDLQYHEKHQKWRETGHLEGWWKCRSGTDAPLAERECSLCHKPKTTEEIADIVDYNTPIAERKQQILDHVAKQVKEGVTSDREAVEEMWCKEGIPQHLGPSLTPEETMAYEREITGVHNKCSL